MKDLGLSYSGANSALKELVKKFIAENKTNVQALDAFLSDLEDQCQNVNALVDALDATDDLRYEEDWLAHHHD